MIIYRVTEGMRNGTVKRFRLLRDPRTAREAAIAQVIRDEQANREKEGTVSSWFTQIHYVEIEDDEWKAWDGTI
jgi:hypothetical protein